MKIVPAILTSDVFELDELLRKVRDSKRFERVQIDFIDGEYAANKTIKPSECDLIPYLPLKFDAQLMVTENNVWEWAKYAKVMGFERIIPQVESISEPKKFKALAMDFHSPVKVVEPYLNKLDYVLVMSVEPGFGGQDFVNAALEDVKELNLLKKEKHYKFKIGIDGGIEKIHLEYLESHGVDEVCVGAKRCLEW
jgi:ribulose-phosphate 3-epimerase